MSESEVWKNMRVAIPHQESLCGTGEPMMDTNIYQAAMDLWGAESQLGMLAEESAELAAASMHLCRGRAAEAEVAEESADVEIMLAQIRLLPGMSEAIDAWKVRKLARLRQTIVLQSRKSVPKRGDEARKQTHFPCVSYVCQCGQTVRIRPLGDGYDSVLEISCPRCGARMIPEVNDDQR